MDIEDILCGSTDIANAYLGIVTAKAQGEDINGALNIAKTMTDPQLKSETLISIGYEQKQCGDIDGAKRTFRDALRAADNINDPFSKCARLRKIAHFLAQCRDIFGAFNTLEMALLTSRIIKDEFYQDLSLKNIAMETADVAMEYSADFLFHRAIDTAIKISYTIDDYPFRFEALRYIDKLKKERELKNGY
jgi:DNA-binding protein